MFQIAQKGVRGFYTCSRNGLQARVSRGKIIRLNEEKYDAFPYKAIGTITFEGNIVRQISYLLTSGDQSENPKAVFRTSYLKHSPRVYSLKEHK
jgi:hypothetical protein